MILKHTYGILMAYFNTDRSGLIPKLVGSLTPMKLALGERPTASHWAKAVDV